MRTFATIAARASRSSSTPNAFILLSNGSETKVGTLTSEWEHFFEWKRVADEQRGGSKSRSSARCEVSAIDGGSSI